MAFILAPYNNAMRMGQGFNTFTQQICIDDAVVTDPDRAENVLANDGSTMRIMVQSMGRPSAWSRQKEVVEDKAYMAVKLLDDNGDDDNGSAPATKSIEGSKATPNDSEGSNSEDRELTPAQTEGELDSDNNATQNNTGISAADEKEAKSETSSEEGVVVDNGESDAEQEPVAAIDTEKPSAAHGDQLNEAETSLEEEEAVTAEKTADAPKPSANRKAVAALKSIAATRAIANSESTLQKPKVLTASTVKAPTKNVKSGNKGNLYTSEDTKNIDGDQYRSQEERERQREEMKQRREHERERREEERERRKQDRELRQVIERERWEEEKQLRADERKQRQEDAAWNREQEKLRRDEQKENIKQAASITSYSANEMAARKKELDVVFEERFKGMLENKKDYEFDEDPTGGPSQIVTYTSRFVDKLSDITDDMNISGSLSIKAGKFGGSGRGSFINTDKFKESDLNFYISVKVVNQTINFKDALVYNPVRSVNKENFNAVFGDGFISGFQEGGEFNALVSMKILNKAKKSDIRAEAKVAFTAGPIDVKAEANVNIAKSNIETNTETTIQVSWSGGGHIKPREQQWDIQSLMQAAARFPDLVARCPQRIYAIITKYESLRSFVKTKPAGYTKLQYENAQMYTNAMMDAYMSYKSLYTKIGSQIFDVQNKTKKIKAWEDTLADEATLAAKHSENPANTAVSRAEELSLVHDTFPFPASMSGLTQAKKAIRRQMALIVNEVDIIEQDPKKATDDDHFEPFQDPVAFEERLPIVKSPEKPKSTIPLSGKRIMAKTEIEDENAQVEEDVTPPALMADTSSLSSDEQSSIDGFLAERPTLGKTLQLTMPLGSQTKGSLFHNLEFLQPQWKIIKVSVEIHDGAIAVIWVYYDNGLVLTRGKTKGGRVIEMTDFEIGERIISVSIQIGKAQAQPAEHQVIALLMYTNRGRSFIGQAATCSYDAQMGHTRDGTLYTDVQTRFFDGPLQNGNLKGFYGRVDEKAVWRLGLIWGNLGRDEGHDGFIDSAPASDTMDPLTQAKSESTGLKIKIDSLNSQLADYSKLCETLKSDVTRLETQEKKHLEQIDNLTKEAENLRRSALSWGSRGDVWRSGPVEIYHVLWGGIPIWDLNVASRLLGYAIRNEEFSINAETFGCNSWDGVWKSAHILYRYDNTGEMRCLSGRQDASVRFDHLQHVS